MSVSSDATQIRRVPTVILWWAAGLALVLLGVNVADYWSRTQVLHEPASLPGLVLDGVMAVLSVTILASCLIQGNRPAARVLLKHSLAGALALFLAGTLWFTIVFCISISQTGLSMWRFYIPAIGLLAVLSAWPYVLWRRLRSAEAPQGPSTAAKA